MVPQLRRLLALLLSGAALLPAALSAADPPARPFLQLELGAHAGSIRRLAIDEQRGIVVTASDDKTARVWDLRSGEQRRTLDRKSTRLNSSHLGISYAVFCLK